MITLLTTLLKGLSPLYKIGSIIALLLSLWGGFELWDYIDDTKAVAVHETKVNKAIDEKVKTDEAEIKQSFEKPVSTELNDFADSLLKPNTSNTSGLQGTSENTQHADQRPEGNYYLGSTDRLGTQRTGTDPQQAESTETVINDFLSECDPEQLALFNYILSNAAPECVKGEWKLSE